MASRIGRDATIPRPFLKWAGGKRSLLGEIFKWLPAHIGQYIEPFVGGGAVFFELARLRRFDRAVLGDRNRDLVEVWQAVKEAPRELVRLIGRWKYDQAVYYEVRGLDPKSLTEVERAARLLYMNRAGFNGLYRVNQSGQFNVPFGRYTNPTLVDEENLLACSAVLQNVELVCGDFDQVLARAEPGAVTYCDPPYWPVSKSASFTAYDPYPFGPEQQRRLAETFAGLPARGLYGVLSNSDTPETRALYASLPTDTVYARRNISRDAAGRGDVSEILVRTHARVPRPA